MQFAGIVGISEVKLKDPYGWLEFTARAVDGLFYLHQRGVYLKLHRFQSNIIKQIVDLTYLPPSSIAKISTIRIPWSVIYAYVSKNIDEMINEYIGFFDLIGCKYYEGKEERFTKEMSRG